MDLKGGGKMPREKDTYADFLEDVRRRAKELYPDKLIYTQQEAAEIIGCNPRTLRRRGLHSEITSVQLARLFA